MQVICKYQDNVCYIAGNTVYIDYEDGRHTYYADLRDALIVFRYCFPDARIPGKYQVQTNLKR